MVTARGVSNSYINTTNYSYMLLCLTLMIKVKEFNDDYGKHMKTNKGHL